MLVEQRDYGFDVSSLDDVQGLWTFYQDTVEDFQNPWEEKQNIQSIHPLVFICIAPIHNKSYDTFQIEQV